MKIKMIHEISGLVDGVPWPARGGVIDVNDDEARRLIDLGAAEVAGKVEAAVADESGVETAAVDTEPKKRVARKA